MKLTKTLKKIKELNTATALTTYIKILKLPFLLSILFITIKLTGTKKKIQIFINEIKEYWILYIITTYSIIWCLCVLNWLYNLELSGTELVVVEIFGSGSGGISPLNILKKGKPKLQVITENPEHKEGVLGEVLDIKSTDNSNSKADELMCFQDNNWSTIPNVSATESALVEDSWDKQRERALERVVNITAPLSSEDCEDFTNKAEIYKTLRKKRRILNFREDIIENFNKEKELTISCNSTSSLSSSAFASDSASASEKGGNLDNSIISSNVELDEVTKNRQKALDAINGNNNNPKSFSEVNLENLSSVEVRLLLYLEGLKVAGKLNVLPFIFISNLDVFKKIRQNLNIKGFNFLSLVVIRVLEFLNNHKWLKIIIKIILIYLIRNLLSSFLSLSFINLRILTDIINQYNNMNMKFNPFTLSTIYEPGKVIEIVEKIKDVGISTSSERDIENQLIRKSISPFIFFSSLVRVAKNNLKSGQSIWSRNWKLIGKIIVNNLKLKLINTLKMFLLIFIVNLFKNNPYLLQIFKSLLPFHLAFINLSILNVNELTDNSKDKAKEIFRGGVKWIKNNYKKIRIISKRKDNSLQGVENLLNPIENETTPLVNRKSTIISNNTVFSKTSTLINREEGNRTVDSDNESFYSAQEDNSIDSGSFHSALDSLDNLDNLNDRVSDVSNECEVSAYYTAEIINENNKQYNKPNVKIKYISNDEIEIWAEKVENLPPKKYIDTHSNSIVDSWEKYKNEPISYNWLIQERYKKRVDFEQGKYLKSLNYDPGRNLEDSKFYQRISVITNPPFNERNIRLHSKIWKLIKKTIEKISK